MGVPLALHGFNGSTDALGGGSSGSGSSSGSSGSSGSGPSQPREGFDHTFVRSHRGDKWGCFGRDEDPKEVQICVGGNDRDIRFAKCIGKLPVECGIVYGVTGVCHTAADRLLASARLTVHEAGGYPESLLTFGHCGSLKDPSWPAKYGTCKVGGIFPLSPVDVTALDWARSWEDGDTPALFERALLGTLEDTSLTRRDKFAREVEYLLHSKLPTPVSSSYLDALLNERIQFAKEHQQLCITLQQGQVPFRDFAIKSNSLLEKLLQQFEARLGQKAFASVFGLPPKESCQLINPDAQWTASTDGLSSVELDL